jgi:hypothetical protein
VLDSPFLQDFGCGDPGLLLDSPSLQHRCEGDLKPSGGGCSIPKTILDLRCLDGMLVTSRMSTDFRSIFDLLCLDAV